MDERMGNNLNGPSAIRVPDWINNPLGKYYLYFAHHDGRYIRLAYADEPAGPWRIYTPGTISLEQSHFEGHIASPDVHVDEETNLIRMYFHGSNTRSGAGGAQFSRVALSSDGISFNAKAEPLGNPYWRVFCWGGFHYAIGMPGVFYRSRDGVSGFEKGPTLFSPNMRHSAVDVRDDRLMVYFTDVGDSPERIKLSTIELTPSWDEWEASKPVNILKPELQWEGAEEPLKPSERGLVHGAVNQLRDPALLRDYDKTYLFYSVAGESGIAIAEVKYYS